MPHPKVHAREEAPKVRNPAVKSSVILLKKVQYPPTSTEQRKPAVLNHQPWYSTRNSSAGRTASKGSDTEPEEDDPAPASRTVTKNNLPTKQQKATYKLKIKELEEEKHALQAKYDLVMDQLSAARQKGYSKRNSGYADMVKKKTRKELWRICKFMTDERYERVATEKVLDIIKMREFMLTNDKGKDTVIQQKRYDFMNTYSNDCREALNEQRSYVQSQMKKVAWKLCDEEGDPSALPTIEDIYKVANRMIPLPPEDPSAADAAEQQAEHDRLMKVFLWYWDNLLPACAGNVYWRDSIRRSMCISVANLDGKPCIPPSTEAMTAIMYDNCSEKWGVMWQKKKDDPAYKIPKKRDDPDYDEMMPKYSDPTAGQSKYGGWSHEGLVKFVEAMGQIRKARQTEEAAQLEQICLQMVKDKYGVKAGAAEKTKKKGKKRKDPPTSVVMDFDEE